MKRIIFMTTIFIVLLPVLSLAGVEIPPHMEGKPLFSGETVSSGRLKNLKVEPSDV